MKLLAIIFGTLFIFVTIYSLQNQDTLMSIENFCNEYDLDNSTPEHDYDERCFITTYTTLGALLLTLQCILGFFAFIFLFGVLLTESVI